LALARWKAQRRDLLVSLLRVWCSDDNAVLRQKLRPGIADRIAPLLADIIGQGVQEGVFTVAYPDQMGRVIVSLIQDLNDRLAELVLTAESGPRTLRTVEHTMIVLIAFCLQGLVKFAVWFLVPYETRIRRIASYYDRDGRIISFYDSITLIIMAALVILLMLTEMQYLSFITGLVVGMLTIQVFFHRFSKPLTADKMPESPTPPRKLMSYAIQANPRLAWREIVSMTVLFVWALYMLFVEGL
jgi:hypothetical protein